MSQLSTAVGNAALMIPVVIAIVGCLRSSSTPASLRSSRGGGKGGGRGHAKAGARGGAGFGGGWGGGAESLWISSPLGRLVQGCMQVDFRHVTDEDELMAKANQLRRALFRAMAAGSRLTQLIPALASPSSSPSKHGGKTPQKATHASLVSAPATPSSARVEGIEGWLRLDKARGSTAARLYRVKTDTDIYGDNPHGQGKRRIALFQDDVVTLLSVELEAVVIQDYVPPVEQRGTRMMLKEREVVRLKHHLPIELTARNTQERNSKQDAAGGHSKKRGRGAADGKGDALSDGLWFHAEKLVVKVAGGQKQKTGILCAGTHASATSE